LQQDQSALLANEWAVITHIQRMSHYPITLARAGQVVFAGRTLCTIFHYDPAWSSLRHFINATADADQLVSTLLDVLVAVDQMHKCRVVHMNISVDTVIIRGKWAVLTDLTHARVINDAAEVSADMIGTRGVLAHAVLTHPGSLSRIQAVIDRWTDLKILGLSRAVRELEALVK
jgi:hypothetical protein